MKRVALVAAGVGLVCATPVTAAPRDGQVHQAAANTLGAHLQARGYELSGTPSANTLQRFHEAVARASVAGSASPNTTVAPASRTWQQIIKAMSPYMPAPTSLGNPLDGYTFFRTYPGGNASCIDATPVGQPAGSGGWYCKGTLTPGGGDFGGGGATGRYSCGDLAIKFDAGGNLIVPSYNLDAGKPIMVGPDGVIGGGDTFYFAGRFNPLGNAPVAPSRIGHTQSSVARRNLHLFNMTQLESDWYGVVGPDPNTAGQFLVARVARRRIDGTLTTRSQSTLGSTAATNSGYEGHGSNPDGFPDHKSCPEDPNQDSATFHFYGETTQNGHMHGCIMYYPNPQLSISGYAINPETTVVWTLGWPNNMPEVYKKCAVDPEFMRRLTDALYKNATEQPGYDGVPYEPVTPAQSRPGDTVIDDLGDNPETGATAPPTNGGVNDPPPATPTTPTTPTSGGTDVCDFGPTGCTDPQTGAPTLEEVPTGIMDPIFDWLPDLPSITLDTNNTECPIWNVNLTDFGGPSWQFLLQSHCDLMEGQRAVLGALMIALFGIGAALIVLRA